jgi:ribosomal protein L32
VLTCSSCDATTPEGRFCLRCGAPLHPDFSGRSRGRNHFAAAPHEHVAVPALVSSLFPHLPRASHASFRIALAIGGGAVAGLALLRLFPVALTSAALLLPLLIVVYLADVNLYEEEPWWAVAGTVAWGTVAGIGFGLLAHALAPTSGDVVARGTSQYVVTQGIGLPFCGLLVLLLAPITLLRYRRFNSVLDGVTFGASAAAAFGAAEAITYGARLIDAGFRPAGAVLPWIWRLLSLGVAMPVLTMGAGAAACAALWLRYRAPARDAEALGSAGHPAIALPLAAVLVSGGAIGETFLPAGAWLAWLIVFDLVVVVLLRRAIHVGLLEESLEVPIGPELTCPNCGELTARHTFCGQCGISLQALPKARRPTSPPIASEASA